MCRLYCRIVTSFWDILNRTITHTLTNEPKLNDMQEIPVAPIPKNAGKEATLKQMEQRCFNCCNNCCDAFLSSAISAVPVCFDFRR
jgi:hypothetical protein